MTRSVRPVCSHAERGNKTKSNHASGINFAMVDGSVHFISQNIDMRTYQYLGCRHDGMGVGLP